MPEPSPQLPVVYRISPRVLVLVTLLAGPFLALAVAVSVSRGSWGVPAVVAGIVLVLVLNLTLARLVVREDGFSYRNLMTHRSVAYADVDVAGFVTLDTGGAPIGAAFGVRLRDGRSFPVSLRLFSLHAASLLLAQMQRHGVRVDVPPGYFTERMARQIAEEQARWSR